MAISTQGLSTEQAANIKAQEQLQNQAAANQMAMMRLQTEANQQSQDAAAKSNIQKANHDAIMNMANNIK